MSYQLTDSNGVVRLNPDHKVMTQTLSELYNDERKEVFDDVILTHDSGASISLQSNGCAVFETHESETRKILKELSRDDQLALWIQLAAGRLKALEQLEWEIED
ncbi:MAG: hypothetical protein MI748_18045 [Opitutales bacterium]|nr:hypothetical protein [Opitutales bacterium]